MKLHLHPPPSEITMEGANGSSTPFSVATVKEFTFAGIPLNDVEFIVGGTDATPEARGHSTAGVKLYGTSKKRTMRKATSPLQPH